MARRVGMLVIGVVVAVVVFSLLTGASAFIEGNDPVAPTGGDDRSVVATHTTLHLDRTGRPTVVGEVINRGGEPITDVEVTVTFFSDGETVGEASGTVIRTPIPGQRRSPFDLRLTESVEQLPDDYSVSVDYDSYDGPIYGELRSSDVRIIRQSQDSIELVGEVHNDGDRTVERPRVVAVFYSENGSVIGVRSTRPSPSELRPRESGVFRLTFRTLGDIPSLARQYDSHRIIVFASPEERSGTRVTLRPEGVLG